MIAGGYQFETKDDNNAMRGMRISMAKNIKFHKLPNGKWGLKEWYPNVKEDKEKEVETESNEDGNLTTDSYRKKLKDAKDILKDAGSDTK